MRNPIEKHENTKKKKNTHKRVTTNMTGPVTYQPSPSTLKELKGSSNYNEWVVKSMANMRAMKVAEAVKQDRPVVRTPEQASA